MAELVQSIDMEMFYRDKVEWHTKYGDDMGMFDAGDNVVLHGLVGRPDLNGRHGRIRVRLISRWSVSVEGLSAPVSLKPANLQIRIAHSNKVLSSFEQDET